MPILKLVFGQINFFSNPFPLFEGEEAVKQGCQIGYVDLPNNQTVAIFEIEVADRIIIERNRKGLRDIAAKYIKGTFSAALVFYYSKNQNEYRFSFIAQQSKIDEQTGEFNTVVTAPKRYTYVLGTPFCATAAERWIKLAAEPEINIDKITDAFSVEKLSKEFFDQYKIQYTRFCKFIEDDSVTLQQFIDHTEANVVKAQKPLRDYVKKLLGRLVFLQFLQKKGWMGVPASNKDWKGGDLNFMANLFEKSPYQDNFLDQVLEPLFFNTLNAERTNDIAVDIDSSIKIPYLNGGLFEKTTLDDTCVQFPKHYFSELFEFFNQYNFTIDENDPDDAEVGIDPEMLGHIFENLLEDNKDKGAFYTPKEIVRYMCQESLIAYLHTHTPETLHPSVEKLIRTHKIDDCLQDKPNATLIQKLLVAVKICDPAIGSGAFPMGMLHEIFMVRRLLFGFLGKNESFSACLVKKEIIQNNIYGVDIEQGAVDIARLRFWLALVVDEDVPQALPNLDYKIIQGNSLVESFEGHDLSKIIKTKNSNSGTSKSKITKNLFGEIENPQLTMGFDAAHTEANLNLLIRDYFQINNSDEKHKKADIINDQIKEHIKNCAGHTPEVVEKVNAIDFNNKPFFLWHLYFADVFENGGFDVVIGNPPYLKERDNAKIFEAVNSSNLGKRYHQGKMDFWFYFLHLAIDLTSSNSIISFITSRYWINSQGAKKLISRVKDNLSFVNVVDIGKLKVFDNVAGHHMIHIYSKSKCDCFKYKKIENDITEIAFENQTENLSIDFLENKSVFVNHEIIFAPQNIRSSKSKLGDFYDLSQGVVEASDKISTKQFKKVNRMDVNVGDGIFVLNGTEFESLGLSSLEKSFVMKYLDPNDISSYKISPKVQKYLIYADKSLRLKIENNPEFSTLKNHLDYYSDFITSSNKPYGLHRPREKKYFKNKKILFKGMFKVNEVAIDETGYYVGMSFISIIEKDKKYSLEFLNGLLNSKYAYHWFYTYGKKRGVGVDIGVDKLKTFPIPNKPSKQIDNIVSLIYKNKSEGLPTTDLEQQIDTLVYKLYELSYNEVLLIEPDFGKRVSVEQYEKVIVE